MHSISPLSDEELEALAGDLESDRVERKEAWSSSAAEKSREAVCAFANDLSNHGKPGVLFIGLKDEGKPSGLPITDQLLLTLADIKSDGRIIPPPTMTVEKRRVLNADVAVATVWPADAPPVRFQGRIWVRTGPRRSLATAQDERILNEKRRHNDIPYDIYPVRSARLEDISRTYFEENYLPQAFAPDILAANERSYEQRLSACRMIVSENDPTPTVLGLLTLSPDPRRWLPGAYIQFLRIQGTALHHPIIDEAVVFGRLERIFERLNDLLEAHNRVSVDITSETREIRSYLYPPDALQQLASNAVMHRTYEGGHAPVRVHWFDDRIEIISPGGPFGEVTAETFGLPGYSSYRNPHIAEALRVLNIVQRFGVGISIAQSALKANGNPPASFEVDSNFVFARIQPRPTP